MGKVPGFFVSLQSTSFEHEKHQLLSAIDSAMGADPVTLAVMRGVAVQARFPVQVRGRGMERRRGRRGKGWGAVGASGGTRTSEIEGGGDRLAE